MTRKDKGYKQIVYAVKSSSTEIVGQTFEEDGYCPLLGYKFKAIRVRSKKMARQ